ncbi:helix-turn-helix domain-containing protein [Lyngbya sp. CCY1209]|uniref:helix-turn-helix domain-containing protein n=1 Tax=Lyngbya sp. CCY1209 TaxID=2886103 RepID=UPI002D1FC74A|nr:helix-turn-helix domain-containing protein [Lyngbya sp. CCY1209]MEB3884933.1 helix-turn-helix domain-containing protein [Lyngbya sp. CCY1209]
MDRLPPTEYTPRLQRLMQQAGFSSLRELSRASGVGELQFFRLCQGLALQTRVEILIKIAAALQISLAELLAAFTPDGGELAPQADSSQELRREYRRVQAELEQLRESLAAEFQGASLQTLESWLLQWPTAAQKARENPQLAAKNLLPLLKPVERLVQQWGVEIVAPVGSRVSYDPHLHQLIEGTAKPGDAVVVRYAGYRQGDRLLYRAKVGPER